MWIKIDILDFAAEMLFTPLSKVGMLSKSVLWPVRDLCSATADAFIAVCELQLCSLSLSAKALADYLALSKKKCFTFNSVAIRILSAAWQCLKHTHTFGRRSMDYIPSNYLITLMSTKQSGLNILPNNTNTFALARLELTV